MSMKSYQFTLHNVFCRQLQVQVEKFKSAPHLLIMVSLNQDQSISLSHDVISELCFQLSFSPIDAFLRSSSLALRSCNMLLRNIYKIPLCLCCCNCNSTTLERLQKLCDHHYEVFYPPNTTVWDKWGIFLNSGLLRKHKHCEISPLAPNVWQAFMQMCR